MPLIADSSLQSLSHAYPAAPALLHHSLEGHPLLDYPALAEAARALPQSHVERRVADAVNGGDFAHDSASGQDAATLLETMQVDGNWIMLRCVEQLPAYRKLLEELIAVIAPAISPATGTARNIKGFVFISAPGTLTPFHFDCEHNILFQVRGDKQFATYPPAPPWLPLDRHEAYFAAGDNMLPWQEDYLGDARVHSLTAGDALFVPYASPHWVKAGSTPSISLSMTWQCDWSHIAADAMLANPLLRRIGAGMDRAPAWPARPRWRAWCGRVARRAGLA
ncbi:cupin-like domain-containing protein [Sphingopyxis sp. MWB1]|uniref:cupin-like domain-containing protein n=1 Tax=Sphingopyxis sp. MWB1 TaxID=1537715 RepID=UPI00051A6984|nr:cupin-like domain-containing protein [Sphingopyxis sp. MWB1]